MFTPNSRSPIWLYTKPADMRKSYSGLLGLVKRQLQEDPLNGYYVFINRRKTQMKVLYFESTGYCIWSKRLSQGHFNYAENVQGKQALTVIDLQHILAGIKVEKYRQYKRYQPNA